MTGQGFFARRLERLGADFGRRFVSGAALAAMGALAIGLGGWAMALLASAAAGVMAWETRSVAHGRPEGSSLRSLPLVTALAGAPLLAQGPGPLWAAGLLALGGVVSALLEKTRGLDPRWSLLAAGYAGMAAVSLVWLRNGPAFGMITAIWLVAVVAATDIGAYVAGRLIGGPKLAPRISPKKTWAGLIGGVSAACLVGALFSALTHGTWLAQVGVLSVLAAVVSQMGDLAESAFKRRFGVKDASNIIPGHGGVMDRVDGLMAAALLTGLATLLRGKEMFA